MKTIKPYHLSAILSFIIIFILWNPLAFSASQNFLVSSLVTVLAIWATDALHKSLACIILLVAFILFGKTPAQDIFSFAWSGTNLLIVTTTLLSVGLMNTGLIHRLVSWVMAPFVTSISRFMIFPYLLGIVLVFMIPQGFARVIVVGTIFDRVIKADSKEEKQGKSILLFNAFLGVTLGYMFFPNGDIVLNYSALQFAGPDISQQLDFWTWFQLMSVPTVATILAVLLLQGLLFKAFLKEARLPQLPLVQNEDQGQSQSNQVLASLSILGLLIAWQTEVWHGIPAWLLTALVLLLFFFKGILVISDLKQVNPHFLLFLLTIFGIGKVLGQSGVTTIIFEKLQRFLPESSSFFFLFIMMGLVMFMHLSIGSAVATMSVVLPLLFPLMEAAGYQGAVVLLMTYSLVNIHFLLPFHHATMLIGIGKGYYSEKTMLIFGLAMTLVAPLLVFGFYFGWWQLMGWL